MKKGSIIGSHLKKELDDMEYDDDVSDDLQVMDEDVEVIDDDIDGKKCSDGVGVNMVNAKESMVGNVSQGNGAKKAENFEKMSNVNKVNDDMPVPFSENVILNPGGNGTNVVINAGSLGQDSEEMVNNVWPTLNEINNKGSGGNENGIRMDSSGSNKLFRIPMRMNEKGENVADMDPMIEEGSKRWDMTLVGYFVSLKMSNYEISGHLRRMWRSHQLAEIITNDSGFYFLKFISDEGLNFVLENGPWLVDGKPFFVQKWEAGLCMDKPEPTRVPLWVKIMNVPLEAWNTHGISRLASCIGNPIIMDRITMSMCDKAYGRASFARVLIEVDASKECKNREMTEEEKDEDVRIPNRNRASTSKNGGKQSNEYVLGNRGGFNGRGRGGMNGRGGMIGRGGVYQRGSNDGNVIKCVPVKDGGHMVDNVQVIKDKNSSSKVDKGKNVINDTNGCERKVADKNVVNVKNNFMVIANGIIEIGGDEWMQMKKKIDLACELGMQIDTNMIEGLKWRISKLKKDISYGHNKFETLDGMKVNDTIKKTFEGVMDCMETNMKDKRALWNSNGIGVKSFGVQDFRDCVDLLSLDDVKIMGMFFTWIQKRNDPSAGILKKLDMILGNCHFVSDYHESYANFLPFNVSDHAPAILVMLDGVRKKNRAFRRLKFLKKHLRDLNRKNGDVFMKSKMLKEELARVQDALGKDPSNTSLREEELIYAKAYKKAALDEELILKIEGACDDAGNILYGEHMVNKFVDHFKNFFRHADKVYHIDDPGSLFIKKLDAITVVDLIKLVTNEEVKTALFNIEDNKASGPDGYTSKFFKFAWKIAGEDVCSAIKEFFTSCKLLGEINTSIIPCP
ncbi:gag-pol polyprotein [Tanacetum coccineum]